MARRVLIPPALPAALPLGGLHGGRLIWDYAGATMGTYWRARVVEADGLTHKSAGDLIRRAIERVVALMSPWEPTSDLARYAAAPAGSWVAMAPETFRVLTRALEVAALTQGRYDPTIGRLTDALGFGPSDPAVAVPPDSHEAHAARATTGFASVRLDAAGGTVFQPGGFRLDLCSIAKGYAVDLAVESLQSAGALACFVEIGGEARGIGCKPDGQPWWCRIEPPDGVDHRLTDTVVAACNVAIATSGNALRTRLLPTGPLGHILNPVEGERLCPTLESVTILAPTCMEADVFATALFVLGPEEGGRLAREQGIAALFVERDPRHGYGERWSPGFAEFLA